MKTINFTALLLVIALALTTYTAQADSSAIDFETYSIGNIQGQDGWSKTGPYDVSIVANSYGYSSFGGKSLRISNAVTSGSFGDHAYSKSLVDEAGESTSSDAYNNGYSGGVRQSYFEAEWDFASTSPNSEQAGLSVTASPDRGDGARMGWVQMTDTPAGLDVNFYDYQISAAPPTGDFVFTNIASGLDRTVPHRIKIAIFFIDGPENDIVKVYVDGILKHMGTSWEDYFRQNQPPGTRTVDSILFRTGGTAVPATLGNGFLIDNLSIFSGPIPVTQCTLVCYVDDTGDDANGGTSPVDAKQTIQAAIDMVDPGGTVRVLPGNYSETATNRWVLGTNGPHQFGLFVDKDGVTIQGVTAGDIAITDYNTLGAYITTNATNNFGASGIFVQGDDVTIAGLRIGPNVPGDNKTIEIIGDGFTLKDSHVDVPGGGSVYFNDWRFDTINDISYVQSYTIDHNLIDQSTSIDITSGTGYSGPTSGRQITNNKFENADYWPSISFNGSGTGVEWFIQSVGGAVIENNTFTNTFNGNDVRAGHIRVRGDVDVSQFDWTAYWNDNIFNKAVVILEGAYPPFNVRQYNYTSGTYSFDVRRIGVNIQGSIDKAVAGDTVLVKDGTYNESPNINKPLTLKSWTGHNATIIQLQAGPTYLGALTVDANGTTVIDGFTIVGFDAVGSGLASTNIIVTTLPDDVTVKNNRIKVGAIGSGSNGDDGFGINTYYNTASDVASLNVTHNIFEPLNSTGTRAFYINPGVDHFLFFQNEISGNFTRTAVIQAKDGIVEENTLTGVGSEGSRSRGFSTWGYPDPTIYGHTTFRNNTITGVSKGVTIYETNNVTVENNFFVDNDVAVWIGDNMSLTFNPATIYINENSIVNSSAYGVQNASAFAGIVNAEVNWWDSNLPANVAAEVSGAVDFTPWLCVGTDTSPDPGFQPTGQTDCSAPVVTGVSVSPSPVYLNAVTILNATADDSATGNSNIASAEYNLNNTGWLLMTSVDGTFDEPNEAITATFTASTFDSNTVCVRAKDFWGNLSTPTCFTFTVGYKFTGFFQPIDMNAVNIAKAGQAIPAKWRLTDANGVPISDPASFVGLYSYNVSCTDFNGTQPDVIETYSGSSGLQYLGDGYWQFNWKTPKSYANTCRTMYVKFQGGFKSPEVDFKFK